MKAKRWKVAFDVVRIYNSIYLLYIFDKRRTRKENLFEVSKTFTNWSISVNYRNCNVWIWNTFW